MFKLPKQFVAIVAAASMVSACTTTEVPKGQQAADSGKTGLEVRTFGADKSNFADLATISSPPGYDIAPSSASPGVSAGASTANASGAKKAINLTPYTRFENQRKR